MLKILNVAALAAAAILLASPLSMGRAAEPADAQFTEHWQEPSHPLHVGPDGVERPQYAELTTFTPDGRGEINYGNHILDALDVFSEYIIGIILAGVGALYAAFTKKKLDSDDAAFLMSALRNAYGFGVNAIAPALKDKKLTVEEASPVVEWMLYYADKLLPDLTRKFGGREANRLRAWAIVPLAEGQAIPMANPAASPVAQPAPPSNIAPIAVSALVATTPPPQQTP